MVTKQNNETSWLSAIKAVIDAAQKRLAPWQMFVVILVVSIGAIGIVGARRSETSPDTTVDVRDGIGIGQNGNQSPVTIERGRSEEDVQREIENEKLRYEREARRKADAEREAERKREEEVSRLDAIRRSNTLSRLIMVFFTTRDDKDDQDVVSPALFKGDANIVQKQLFGGTKLDNNSEHTAEIAIHPPVVDENDLRVQLTKSGTDGWIFHFEVWGEYHDGAKRLLLARSNEIHFENQSQSTGLLTIRRQ